MKDKGAEPPSILNRRARMDYRVVETLEAGLVLTGTEVKSIRKGNANINHAFARVMGDAVLMMGSHVEEYAQGNRYNHNPKRDRKLLLHKREIQKLKEETQIRGRALVPLKLYFNARGKAKIELAICESKTHGDRREDLKKKAAQREVDQATKKFKRGR